MRKRTQARELALQLLYQIDLLRGKITTDERGLFLTEHAESAEVREYARELVSGVEKHQPEIDTAIDEVAKNWELGRMAVIDRNILRMGILELLHREDIPPKVAINEAVDLAKKYSTKNSSAFVNGILDKVKERRAPGEAPSAAAPLRPLPPVEAGADGPGAEPVDESEPPLPSAESEDE